MKMPSVRFSYPSFLTKETLILSLFSPLSSKIHASSRNPRNLRPFSTKSIQASVTRYKSISAVVNEQASPFSGIDDALMGFICGERKATEVAHFFSVSVARMWQKVIHKGDIVVDATCGNGHDTLALVKMVADESSKGRVYGMDIQNAALENTSSLLDESVNPKERELVKLFLLCHSRMEDVIPKGTPVRLVAFNLGYLPGGDKTIITTSKTTLPALEAASRILGCGGLISAMVYVGHPGGREELETVQAFASSLSVDAWVCCKLEMLNRPSSPVLILLFKKLSN